MAQNHQGKRQKELSVGLDNRLSKFEIWIREKDSLENISNYDQ